MTGTELARRERLLNESKLRAPVIRPGVVSRARLGPLRDAAQRSRLVLVSAPAGYGKSTLVAEWSELDPRVSSWVQLDDSDNDPVVLLAEVAAALGANGSGAGDALEELSRRHPRIEQVVLPLLGAEINHHAPFVLALDDVHVLRSEKSLTVLKFLTEQIPPGAQLVLSTRGEPAIPLGRLRAKGELSEIRTEDLALDANETRAVAASGGVQLTEDSAEALRERTEGWAAAIVLATLSLRGRDDAAADLPGLVGNQHQIADFLLEEVLKNQPDRLRAFLLGTSILERMTAPLCGAVLGVADAAESLDALSRSNAFVVSLDDHREWYRYHHLFRELLRAELEQRHPELLPAYLARAADWCELYGRPDEAFSYAQESGSVSRAGRIALAQRDEFTRHGRNETMRVWLSRCTDDEIASDPQLAIAAAWVFGYLGDRARSSHFIAAAERWPLDVPSADEAMSLRSALANVRSVMAPAGIPQMLRDGELIYRSEKKAGTRWFVSGCRAMGIAYVLLDRPQEARAVLEEALAATGDRSEVAHVRVISLAYLSFAAADMGDRRDLHRWSLEATRVATEERLEWTAYAAMAHTAAAIEQIRRGDHVAAAQRLREFQHVRPLLRGAPWLNADLALRCADVSLDLGERAGAIELARVAREALWGFPDGGTLPARLQRLDERIQRGEDYDLTPAELRLLHFLPSHLSLQEIAERLYLSRATVKTQVASIYSKLGVAGRSEAVDVMEQLGLGPVAGPDPDLV
ncbi:MAG: LuxR C-terminal-related transcriptional regulator [Solirubrobacteraceae bacterium]